MIFFISVVFTAKGGRIILCNIIEFTDIKTVYGLSIHSVYTGGNLYVTIPGCYLITINIFATKNPYIYIYKMMYLLFLLVSTLTVQFMDIRWPLHQRLWSFPLETQLQLKDIVSIELIVQ